MKKLKLENPESVLIRVQAIFDSCKKNNFKLNRTPELKSIFKPYFDKLAIGNSWFSVMEKGQSLPRHKDSEYATSFLYYLKSDGSSPLVIEGEKYYVKTGDFITYNSFAEHWVPPVKEEERVTLVIETSEKILASDEYEEAA